MKVTEFATKRVIRALTAYISRVNFCLVYQSSIMVGATDHDSWMKKKLAGKYGNQSGRAREDVPEPEPGRAVDAGATVYRLFF